jgi:hypothetical protein
MHLCSGTGQNTHRVPLTAGSPHPFRGDLKLRCHNRRQPIGSDAEREPLLMKRNVTKAGAPWESGLTTVAMRKYLTAFRAAAVALIQEQATREPSLERVAQLDALARQVAGVSPHQLRHGLAYRLWETATPEATRQILGHSRVANACLLRSRHTRTLWWLIGHGASPSTPS